MEESGKAVLSPGTGEVKSLFAQRAHVFSKDDEISTSYVYEVEYQAQAVETDGNPTESIYSPVPGV